MMLRGVLVACLAQLVCLTNASTLRKASGSITKPLHANVITVGLASDGSTFPDLVSISSSLDCVLIGVREEKPSQVLGYLTMHSTYQCHLKGQYEFLSCPELLRGDVKSARFVLNTEGKTALRVSMPQQAFPTSNQKCDNMLEFQFEEESPKASKWKPILISLFATAVAVLFILPSPFIYRRMKIKQSLKKFARKSRDFLRIYAKKGDSLFPVLQKNHSKQTSRTKKKKLGRRRRNSYKDSPTYSDMDEDSNFHFNSIEELDFTDEGEKVPYLKGKNRSFR